MSENGPRRMRLVAVGAAVLAMVLALTAVIVVLTRGGEPAKPTAKVETAPLRDHDVRATDVVRVRYETEAVVEKGMPRGVRIKDAALAQALGLQAGEVITALSGKPVTSERDVIDVIMQLGLMDATMLYVEVTRDGTPTLLRWRLDGDLGEARRASTGSRSTGSVGRVGGLGSPYTPSYPAPTTNDPLLDTIEKIDDAHYKLPRKTIDEMLGNPMAYMKGARVVPAIRNGKPDGFKLYAIRPSSVFHKLGFMNGDTVHAINGTDIANPDDALEVYTKLKNADVVAFGLTRRGRPVLLTIEITK